MKPHLPSLRRIERDLHLPSGDVTSRTLTWQSQREERLARLRQEHDDQLRRVCTFQPNADAAWGGRVGEFEDSESDGSQITTVTEGERRKIAAEASERLYYKGMQAKRQKQKMLRRLLETQFAQICPFQPNASQQAPRPDSAPPRVRFRGDDEAPSDGAGSARPDLRGEDGRLRVPLTRPHYMLPRECDAETTEFTTSDRRLMEELEECTFHPRVNGPSKVRQCPHHNSTIPPSTMYVDCVHVHAGDGPRAAISVTGCRHAVDAVCKSEAVRQRQQHREWSSLAR